MIVPKQLSTLALSTKDSELNHESIEQYCKQNQSQKAFERLKASALENPQQVAEIRKLAETIFIQALKNGDHITAHDALFFRRPNQDCIALIDRVHRADPHQFVYTYEFNTLLAAAAERQRGLKPLAKFLKPLSQDLRQLSVLRRSEKSRLEELLRVSETPKDFAREFFSAPTDNVNEKLSYIFDVLLRNRTTEEREEYFNDFLSTNCYAITDWVVQTKNQFSEVLFAEPSSPEVTFVLIDFVVKNLNRGNFAQLATVLDTFTQAVLKDVFIAVTEREILNARDSRENNFAHYLFKTPSLNHIAITMMQTMSLKGMRDLCLAKNKGKRRPLDRASATVCQEVEQLFKGGVQKAIKEIKRGQDVKTNLKELCQLYTKSGLPAFAFNAELQTELQKIVDESQDPFLKAVAAREKQLQKGWASGKFEKAPASKTVILGLARFIEDDLKREAQLAVSIFHPREFATPRVIQYDGQKIFVGALPSKSCISASGTYKRVSSAISLDSQDLKIVNCAARAIAVRKDYEEDILQRELNGFDEVRGEPYFLQAHSKILYQRRDRDGNLYWTFSICMQQAERSLENMIFDTSNPLPIGTKIAIMANLIDALAAFHKKGKVHGDLKPQNIAIIDSVMSFVDFGFTRSVKVGEITENRGGYNQGFYGSIYNTPLELVGERDFDGDHFAVECYGLAGIFWEMYYGKAGIPTKQSVYDFYDMDPDLQDRLDQPTATQLRDSRGEMRDALMAEVEAPLAQLTKKMKEKTIPQAYTLDALYRLIMYSMMRIDPKERMTLAAAQKLLNMIK